MMERKVTRSENDKKLKYESPHVRRVRLDAAGSVLGCSMLTAPPCIQGSLMFVTS